MFKNVYERDDDTMKEVYRKLFFGNGISVTLIILCVIDVIIGVIAAVFFENFIGYMIVAMAVLIIVKRYVFYREKVRTVLGADKELNGGKSVTITISALENGLALSSEGNPEKNVDYSAFVKLYGTDNLLILKSEANLLYVLRKDSFVIGDADGFCKFIKNKNDKLK